MNPKFRDNLVQYLNLFVKVEKKGKTEFEAEIELIQKETKALQAIFTEQFEKI
jgi:hypothetical protein